MTTRPKRICVVRLTDDAVEDLHRLGKKDPNIVRTVFKKMLLLERSPNAGDPLLGALIGFRKLVVATGTGELPGASLRTLLASR